MKVFTADCTFDYAWEEVSTANWRKYCPWNDKSPHVLAVDTLSRTVDEKTGILRTERLITCQQSCPAWVSSLLGGNAASYVHETSYVDPAARRVTMVSSNMTWANLLNVRETVVYTPEPLGTARRRGGDSGSVVQQYAEEQERRKKVEQTHFKQEAKVTALCGGWQKVRTKIEEATVERFGENAQKGREGFEAVLQMSRKVFGDEKEKQATMMA